MWNKGLKKSRLFTFSFFCCPFDVICALFLLWSDRMNFVPLWDSQHFQKCLKVENYRDVGCIPMSCRLMKHRKLQKSLHSSQGLFNALLYNNLSVWRLVSGLHKSSQAFTAKYTFFVCDNLNQRVTRCDEAWRDVKSCANSSRW